MRRDAEFFGEAELDLLFVARRLRDALDAEKVLTKAGVDYAVETGTYTSGFLIKRDLAAAFFYVATERLPESRVLLIESGFKPYDPE